MIEKLEKALDLMAGLRPRSNLDKADRMHATAEVANVLAALTAPPEPPPCPDCNGTGWETPEYTRPSEDFCEACGGSGVDETPTAPPVALGWAPIDSAPHGQWVLVYFARFKDYAVCRWNDEGVWEDEDDSRYTSPSHWMPLPPAPQEPTP